jgi:hypothetical protein
MHTPVGMIFNEDVLVSLMLFVNYETISCNIFELLNVIIGLVIIFGVIFCSNYGTYVLYLQKNIWFDFCIRVADLSGPELIIGLIG